MNINATRKLRWQELIHYLPDCMPCDGSATCFMPHHSTDIAFYEVMRLTVCSNCITHADEHTPAHVAGNLKLKDTWSQVKKDYGLVDFVMSSNAPINEADYILTYGWALARKGLFIGGDNYQQWWNRSKVVDKLGAPRMVDFSFDEVFYYWEKLKP